MKMHFAAVAVETDIGCRLPQSGGKAFMHLHIGEAENTVHCKAGRPAEHAHEKHGEPPGQPRDGGKLAGAVEEVLSSTALLAVSACAGSVCPAGSAFLEDVVSTGESEMLSVSSPGF